MDIEYPVYCPLVKREIEAGECFDIHMVVDGWAPKDTVSGKVTSKENFEEICKNCQYHRND